MKNRILCQNKMSSLCNSSFEVFKQTFWPDRLLENDRNCRWGSLKEEVLELVRKTFKLGGDCQYFNADADGGPVLWIQWKGYAPVLYEIVHRTHGLANRKNTFHCLLAWIRSICAFENVFAWAINPFGNHNFTVLGSP